MFFRLFFQYILKIFFIYTQQKTCPCGQVFNNDGDYRPLRRAVSCAIINSSLVGITTATALLSAVVITPALPKRASGWLLGQCADRGSPSSPIHVRG